jgi:glycerol-3-phosphate dehydrogenase
VFGGKITTSRKLAEAVMEKIKPFFPALGPSWTATASLPGGDFPYAEVEARVADLQKRYSFLPPRTARRLFRAYGTHAEGILDGARFAQDMGQSFGVLSEREIAHLKEREWAREAEDILWRRSKLGLHLSAEEQVSLREFMGGKTKRKQIKSA